jgi:predicted transcriptional regulator
LDSCDEINAALHYPGSTVARPGGVQTFSFLIKPKSVYLRRAAYLSNNPVLLVDLPHVIATVHAAISENARGIALEQAHQQKPAVKISNSITPEAIICLEDGKHFKSLKRHLQTKYGMTPDEYRAKWKLPAGYPMVAPSYSAARSALAKRMGLGEMRRKLGSVAPVAAAVTAVPRRSRGKKSS